MCEVAGSPSSSTDDNCEVAEEIIYSDSGESAQLHDQDQPEWTRDARLNRSMDHPPRCNGGGGSGLFLKPGSRCDSLSHSWHSGFRRNGSHTSSATKGSMWPKPNSYSAQHRNRLTYLGYDPDEVLRPASEANFLPSRSPRFSARSSTTGSGGGGDSGSSSSSGWAAMPRCISLLPLKMPPSEAFDAVRKPRARPVNVPRQPSPPRTPTPPPQKPKVPRGPIFAPPNKNKPAIDLRQPIGELRRSLGPNIGSTSHEREARKLRTKREYAKTVVQKSMLTSVKRKQQQQKQEKQQGARPAATKHKHNPWEQEGDGDCWGSGENGSGSGDESFVPPDMPPRESSYIHPAIPAESLVDSDVDEPDFQESLRQLQLRRDSSGDAKTPFTPPASPPAAAGSFFITEQIHDGDDDDSTHY